MCSRGSKEACAGVVMTRGVGGNEDREVREGQAHSQSDLSSL